MSNLEDIALQRISIDHERLCTSFKEEIEAMRGKHASIGKLRSGQTISETIGLSKKCFENFRDLSTNHLQPLVNESIVLTDISVNKVKSSVSSLFCSLNSMQFHTNA